MRINPEYKVREIAGENVVILQGEYGADMTRIITLNDSALLLWNELLGREFAVEDAADVLIKSYDVEETTALRDAQLWIDKLSECKLLD
ncbi:MAG: PqqD family protein [Alistipes sp.]|nr:PqqD family protein [Alistipes sp.]